jgi:hypothetical protein
MDWYVGLHLFFFSNKISTHSLFLETRVIRLQLPKPNTAYLNASKQLLLLMKILKPRIQLPFTMSKNMEQDMKLYFEKSRIWSHVDQCVAMMKSILNSLLCLKNGHMVLYSFFVPKNVIMQADLNNPTQKHL